MKSWVGHVVLEMTSKLWTTSTSLVWAWHTMTIPSSSVLLQGGRVLRISPHLDSTSFDNRLFLVSNFTVTFGGCSLYDMVQLRVTPTQTGRWSCFSRCHSWWLIDHKWQWHSGSSRTELDRYHAGAHNPYYWPQLYQYRYWKWRHPYLAANVCYIHCAYCTYFSKHNIVNVVNCGLVAAAGSAARICFLEWDKL